MQAQRGKASQRLCTCTVELCMLAMVITLCSRRVSQPFSLFLQAAVSTVDWRVSTLPVLHSFDSLESARSAKIRLG